MPFLIRHATVGDAEVVHSIIQAAFAEYRDTIAVPPGALNDTVQAVRDRIAEGRTLIAFGESNEIVGTANYEPRENYLYVGRVAVLPGWRRQGVGRDLMQCVEEKALGLGLPRLKLATRESMPSNVDFYEKLGYRIVERKPHSRGPDVILWFEKELAGADATHDVPLLWACPRCRTPLQRVENALVCPIDGISYGIEEGILRLLDPERAEALRPFIRAYQEQRAEEGWGAPQAPEYYLNLPYKDTTARHAALWKLRARHESALHMMLEPVFDVAESGVGPLILDAGAGNCWLSYRLAEEGARPIALDINDDPADGLGVAEIYHRHAGVEITAVQGELERLPLADGACDAAVINGSLHYAEDTQRALSEAWRVLRPRGRLVIMDSPVYKSEKAGEMMRAEWRQGYVERHGHAPSELPGRGYLTYAEMRRGLGALRPRPHRTIFMPQYTGLAALWRRLKLSIRAIGRPHRRELATHPMWVVERDG